MSATWALPAAFVAFVVLGTTGVIVWVVLALLRDDPNAALPWCVGCPDHEGCGQGACYLDGGPTHPRSHCATGGCRMCPVARKAPARRSS